jgi:hypothetical protein
MTSIDDLKHDLKNVSDSVFRDLDTDERIRLFAQAAAAGEAAVAVGGATDMTRKGTRELATGRDALTTDEEGW